MKKTALLLCLVILATGCASTDRHAVDSGGDVAATNASAEPLYLPALPGAVEYKETEPFSNGDVLIYEAGRQHPVSILFIHGSGDDASSIWKDVIPQVAENYHVVTFDLPGFGRSGGQNVLYSPPFYAECAKWIVDHCIQDRPFIVVGHSLGGAVALCFAATYPDNLQRLILVDASGVIHRTAFTRHIMKGISDKQEGLKKYPLKVFGNFMSTAVEEAETPNISGRIDKILQSPEQRQRILGGDPQKIAGLALANFDFSNLIYEIETPTVILWGAEDSITSVRTAKVLNHTLKKSQLHIVPEAGHNMISDKPQLFNRLLQDSLTSKDWQPPWTAPPKTDRAARLAHQRDVVLSGHYRSIEIEGCDLVQIRNVQTEYIKVIGSNRVSIENSRIEGAEVALHTHESRISFTGGQLSGDTAIVTTGSILDLAGVEVNGRKAAVQAVGGGSKLLFSVSSFETPSRRGYLHGLYEVTENQPLFGAADAVCE
ncbi:alpha/beta hydrolase [Pontiellaceae bacterium B12227]|nr:alpha/beta hydrolase [Pontiellaceae bacterium B12227]